MSLRFPTPACSALALSVFISSPSYAFDAKNYFKELEMKIEADGNEVTIGSITENGADGATLTDIEIIGKKDNSVANISSLTLIGAKDIGDGGFSFESLEASKLVVTGDGKKENEKFSISIDKVSGTDFSLASKENQITPFWPLNLGSMNVENVKFSANGKDKFALNFPNLTVDNLKATEGTGFTVNKVAFGDFTGDFIDKSGGQGEFFIGASSVEGLEHFGKMGVSLDKFSFGNIKGSGQSSKDEKFDVDFNGMTGQNLYVPDAASPDRPLFSKKEGKFDVGNFSISMDGNKLMGWGSATAGSKFDEASNTVTGSGQFNDMFLNVDKMPADANSVQFKAQMKALGYDTLTFDYGGSGTWMINEGLLDMDSLKLSVDDAASIDISMKVSGYTEQLVRQIQAFSAKVQGEKDPQKLQALSMEMLGLYAGLSFVDLEVTTTNNSLVNKVIGMQAAKSGQEPEQMMASLPFMAGAMLPQIGLQSYAQAASDAITNFLKLNGSFTLKAKPDQPVPVMEFLQIQAAMQGKTMSPADLAERFNLEITSN